MLQPAPSAYVEDTELTCSSCGTPLYTNDVQYGHPFITARQLTSMAFQTATRSPKLLKEVMLKEMPAIPYCGSCRQKLPAKRQAEQIKFMLGMLVLCAVLIGILTMVGRLA